MHQCALPNSTAATLPPRHRFEPPSTSNSQERVPTAIRMIGCIIPDDNSGVGALDGAGEGLERRFAVLLRGSTVNSSKLKFDAIFQRDERLACRLVESSG